jgi:K+-sensing histidine kinase KdpD
MNDADTSRFTVALGAGGAIVLGAGLILVRDLTSASNLAFVFLLWTIVMAELGGQAAALATAVTSALSLNFFLTRPYLTLVIDDPEDITAFVALAVCGLVAAAFGRRRQAAGETLRDVRSDLEIIDKISRALSNEPSRGDRLTGALEELRRCLLLRGVVVHDATGRVVAAADPEGLQALRMAPLELQPDAWLRAGATHYRFGQRGLRLPAEGGRIPLHARGERVGTLDLWEGDPAGFDRAEYQTLTVIARFIGAELLASR